jgi:hypothetical protein
MVPLYWPELLTVLGTFIGAAFALVRYTMAQHRAMTDRFVTFLESSLRRQEEVNEGFQEALENLTENVRENSTLLGRLSERVSI